MAHREPIVVTDTLAAQERDLHYGLAAVFFSFSLDVSPNWIGDFRTAVTF